MSTTPRTLWLNFSKDVYEFLCQQVSPILNKALDVTTQELELLSRPSEEGVIDENVFFALKQIKAHKYNNVQKFCEGLENNIKDWGRPVSSKIELSIMDNEELDQNILVDRISEKIEKNNWDNFSTLENSLVMIWCDYRVLSAQDVAQNLPANLLADLSQSFLHPKGMATHFARWIKSWGFAGAPYDILISSVVSELDKDLSSVLKRAINLFINAGWNIQNPILMLHETRKNTENHNLEPTVSVESIANKKEEGIVLDLKQVQIPEIPAVGDNLSDQIADNIAKALFQLLGPGQWKRQFEMEGNLLNQEIGENWDTNLSQFLTLIKGRREREQLVPREGKIVSSEIFYEALKYLQTQSLKNTMDDSLLNENGMECAFKHVIFQTLKKYIPDQDNNQLILPEQDNDAVDIVSTVFDIFLSGRNIPQKIKDKAVDLLPAYVRVAIDDKKLFMNKKHPARVFLDVIAEATEENTGGSLLENTLLLEAEKSIHHISRQFNGDMGVFIKANQDMQASILKNRESVERIEERTAVTQKSKERLDQAIDETEVIFTEALKNSNWPIRTIDLLRKYWSQYHKIILLQADNNNTNAQKNGLQILESKKLLVSLVKVGNEGMLAHKNIIPSLNREIFIMLGASGLIDQAARETALDIWSSLDQANRWNILAQEAKIKAMSDEFMDTPEIFEQEKIDISDVAAQDWKNLTSLEKYKSQISHKDIPSDEELVDFFKSIPLGTWFDFVDGEGKSHPAKLSFISPISEKFVFVNIKGHKHVVGDAYELAILTKKDLLRLREYAVGEKGFEDSFKKAIQKLDNDSPLPQASSNTTS